jgi:hypothetical protein
MDPRHPEQAILRLRELMKQYDRIEDAIKSATTSAQLGQLEREGGLVVQEICLVAPRIHEAMMQVSRHRRYELSHPITTEMLKPATEEAIEHYVAPNQAETVIAEIKPRKKKTTKKAK